MTTISATQTVANERYQSSPRFARLLYAATALLALGYAPIAFNYMWRYFSTGAPQLQAGVTSAIDGRVYAVGAGSVDWLRASAYHENRWVMLIHTSLGGLSLVLATLQCLPVTRRSIRAHRWTGRAFIATMSGSMVTAMAFLVIADRGNFDHSPALWIQLWVLGLSCLATGWTSVAMARAGHIAAHQGFAYLCFAFLMTAPGLRALWVGLHFVFPHAVLVTNLIGGSIAETVAAPFLGVVAFIVTRPREDAHTETTTSYDGPTDDILIAAIALLLTAAHWRTTGTGLKHTELLACYLVPMAAAFAVCVLFEGLAHRSSRRVSAHRWHVLFQGLVASTVATNATWACGAWVLGQTGAFVASTMVTTGFPITIAGLILIREITPTEGHPGTDGGRGAVPPSRSWIRQPAELSGT